MIPESLAALIDETRGQRLTHWAGREVWMANEPWGQLAVSLQGAQVLHFLPSAPLSNASEATRTRASASSPANTSEDTRTPLSASSPGESEETLVAGSWLWVTPTPQDLPGTIRGGIPLCWPWFANEKTADESPDRAGPMHGLARQADWHLEAVDEHEGGVELHLSPTKRLHTQLMPRAVIQANGQRLHVELITEHVGETPIKISGALHTYLAVEDAYACRVEGLAGARFLDKLADFAEREQQGELGVRGRLDRIYHSNAVLTLDGGQRRLCIARQGSDSAVVWNPGEATLSDTSLDAARRFLCVEAANTRLDPVWLVPGAQHLLGTTLSLEMPS